MTNNRNESVGRRTVNEKVKATDEFQGQASTGEHISAQMQRLEAGSESRIRTCCWPCSGR
jgi:hypothetical protein